MSELSMVDLIPVIESNSGLVEVRQSGVVCDSCHEKKTVKYIFKELFRKSYYYKCGNCESFAIEDEITWGLKWYKNA